MRELLYKRSKGFVEKKIGDDLVLVPLANSVVQMEKVFSLNELGTFVYSLMEKCISADELLLNILSQFDVSKEEAIGDLDTFLSEAVNNKIIEIY